MKIFPITILVISLLACAKNGETKTSAQGKSIISKNEKSVAVGSNKSDEAVIHKESHLEINSVSVTSTTGEKWFIGKKIDNSILSKKNTSIVTQSFGEIFGPIDGYTDGVITVGWNNRNRVVYIEILSPSLRLPGGIALGASKLNVLKVLGVPYIENKREFRYQNTENEIVGILFLFNANDRVESIMMFTYV